MYCMSPGVEVNGDTIYLVEMSYNDQQYTGMMSNTKLPYLYYPPFIMNSRSPINAPFGGGFSLGSFHENAKRAVIYTQGEFDYTLVRVSPPPSPANIVGTISFCTELSICRCPPILSSSLFFLAGDNRRRELQGR